MPERENFIKIGLCVITVVTAIALALNSLIADCWTENYSKWPPAKVYQMVLAQPPPAGITDIRCSGRRYLSKRWVWMRFHSNEHAMNELAKLGEQDSTSQAELELLSRISAEDKYDTIDQRKINWQDVDHISKPLYYDFFTGSTATWLWQGLMVIDARRHEVFVQASGS